mmetsp:Transcript_62453/g.143117  ORF Transcript_62453/g.143117 Transcript_62453/m.143117 type:complete len:206 (-) Transcript_62453:899-1516(-)
MPVDGGCHQNHIPAPGYVPRRRGDSLLGHAAGAHGGDPLRGLLPRLPAVAHWLRGRDAPYLGSQDRDADRDAEGAQELGALLCGQPGRHSRGLGQHGQDRTHLGLQDRRVYGRPTQRAQQVDHESRVGADPRLGGRPEPADGNSVEGRELEGVGRAHGQDGVHDDRAHVERHVGALGGAGPHLLGQRGPHHQGVGSDQGHPLQKP